MCAPGCIEHVTHRLSRRALLSAGATSVGAVAGAVAAGVAGADQARARAPLTRKPSAGVFPAFSRVLDLTHTHSPEFPTFDGGPGVTLKRLKALKADGYNMMEWTVLEHSGTHIDAPIHFSADGPGPAELDVERLVVPLVVIDVTDKVAHDPDYQLSPADIRAWEKRHGRLPRHCCVVMYSGWDKLLASPRYVGRDDKGVMHFPGFHVETSHMLIADREVAGIAVDTLSLDHGPSKLFETHYSWLPSQRWGLENVANLAAVLAAAPGRNATLVVGAPKIKGATGGPARLLALV